MNNIRDQLDNLPLCAAHGTKINSSDPPLAAVWTAHPTQPFLPIFHPPIQLASLRPRGRVNIDWRVNFAAGLLRSGAPPVVAEIHI